MGELWWFLSKHILFKSLREWCLRKAFDKGFTVCVIDASKLKKRLGKR